MKFFEKIANIQKDIAISTIGALKHIALWIKSPTGDLAYDNPDFKVPDPTNGISSKGIKLIFIHGTADRSYGSSFIAEQSLQNMPDIISSVMLVSFDHRGEGIGIDEFAEQLKDKLKKNGIEDVIIAGHSRGGILGSYFAEHYAKDAGINVHGLINICSPFMGSHLALPPFSWISSSVKQMQPNSDFLKNLEEKIQQSRKKYYYFSAENDAIVKPDAACISSHRNRLVVLKRHGHLSIMSSYMLVECINRCLFDIVRQKTNHEVVDVNDDLLFQNDFVFLDDASFTPLENVCLDIGLAIEELMIRLHLFSPAEKIDVLFNLLEILHKVMNGNRGEYYPEANTIDSFINAYLQDEKMGKGRKPIDILDDSLNYPFSKVYSLFGKHKAESKVFIENLLAAYKNIPLKTNPCQDLNRFQFDLNPNPMN